MPKNFKDRDIISIKDFSKEEIEYILDYAKCMVPYAKAEKHTTVLKGNILATLFFEPSTRTIISAIGQSVDQRSLKGFKKNPDGTIHVDSETGETSMKGVFAGGDMVTGPGWAIDAIAAGKRGAKAIHQYLSG